jgi:serine/threonine protein kinase
MEIGRGNYSSIFLVEEKQSKFLCAMKIYMKTRVENLRKKGEVLMEKHVLEKISPNKYIIKFIGSNKDDVNLYLSRPVCICYMNT